MFELYKEKLTLDLSKSEVSAMSELVDGLNTVDSLAWCLYVFLLADRSDDNPIKDLPATKREDMAAKIAFKTKIKKYLADEAMLRKVAPTVEAYRSYYNDKTQNDIDLYDNKMAQFIQLLEDTDPVILRNTHEVSGKVSYTTNIDIINKILENAMNIIIDKAIISGVKKSGNFVKSLRGGLSPNAKQTIRL